MSIGQVRRVDVWISLEVQVEVEVEAGVVMELTALAAFAYSLAWCEVVMDDPHHC